MADYKFPTEMVDLPSKGYFYVDGHPLSSGKVEVKYMTAKEEDILTSQNLIQQGLVIDKLLESLIIDKSVKLDDMLIGDKNAIMVSARILGYGKDYQFNYDGEEQSVDLSTLEPVKLDFSKFTKSKNEFNCQEASNVIAEIFYAFANALATQRNYQLSNFYIGLSKYLNPDFLSYDGLLAENLIKLKKYDEAKKIYKKLIALGSYYKWNSSKEIASIWELQGKKKRI